MTILITGANRGIGRALLDSYTAAGQPALGTTRTPGPTGDPLLPLDVTDPASVTALATALQGRPLSLLVCNAGIYHDKGQPLAADLAPERIPVGIYHPGWVQTDMGGAKADISVSKATEGLIARFKALSPGTTGCFETWDGHPLPF